MADSRSPAPEFTLLTACLDASGAQAAVHAAIAGRTIDWTLLLALAARHRVAPLASSRLIESGVLVPEDIRRRLGAIRQAAAYAELRLAGELSRIGRLFDDQALSWRVLKGVPLSIEAHGRLGLRTNRDIDILIQPADVKRALALLGSLGFQALFAPEVPGMARLERRIRTHKDIELRDPATGVIVELHWRLFDNPHMLALEHWSTPKFVRVLPGTDCPVLPDPLNLVYLCNHGAQHAWSRLKWLADLGALLGRIDAGAREDLYRSTSVAAGKLAVGQAMILLSRHCGLAAPAVVERDYRRDWRLSALVAFAERSLIRGGAREIEERKFGSTPKNLSHYLLFPNFHYLLSEARFDLNDFSSIPPDSKWRRLGAVGRLGAWISGRN